MDEAKVLSQISKLQPCHPQTSLVCDVCDGEGFLFPEWGHTAGCIAIDKCIGPPLCPILVDRPCYFCEDGKINFDFCYIGMTMKYTATRGASDHFPVIWRYMKQRYVAVVKEFTKDYLPSYDRFGINPSRKNHRYIFKTLAWTVEESFVIIDTALEEIGFPLHLVTKQEIVSVRPFYGMIKPAGKSKHYDPSLGDAYSARLNKIREIDEVHHRSEESVS